MLQKEVAGAVVLPMSEKERQPKSEAIQLRQTFTPSPQSHPHVVSQRLNDGALALHHIGGQTTLQDATVRVAEALIIAEQVDPTTFEDPENGPQLMDRFAETATRLAFVLLAKARARDPLLHPPQPHQQRDESDGSQRESTAREPDRDDSEAP